jgi:hypothetical protein
MICSDIQARLTEYIDGLLSVQEKAAIDDHLKSCPECTTSLGDLRKTVEHLKELETVDPPEWMTQKIMARVHEQARRPGSLFRKLFYPIHIKLPVEAVAAVLIVGLAFYVYRDISPEMKLAKAPTDEVAPPVMQREIIKEDGVRPLTKSVEERPRQEVTMAPGEPPGGQVRGRAEMKADIPAQSDVKDAGKREEAKPPSPAKSLEQAPVAGSVAKDEARQAARAAAPKAKLSHMEKQEEKTVSFTVFVKDVEMAAKEIEKELNELAGRGIRVESVDGKKVVSAVFFFDKVRQLYEKLKVIGEVKEKEPDIRGQEGMARVRIEVAKYP